MSGSILKEVTFTPQSFDKNFIFENKIRFASIFSILRNLISSAIVVAPNKSWPELVYKMISDYEEDVRDEFILLLNKLEPKIVIYPGNGSCANETDFLTQIEKLNSFREFDFVSGTDNNSVSIRPEEVELESYINEGSVVDKQTVEFMTKMLAPVLSYAEIVKVIDPYFNFFPIYSTKETKDRYIKPMEIICKNLANNHGIRGTAEIEIHTSVKAISKSEGSGKKVLKWEYVDKWQSQIQYYEKEYSHKITIYIWEEKKGEDEWHERYIDTNMCFVSVGKGSDESSWTDSVWSLVKDNNKAEKISNKFRKKGVYTLVATVDSERGLKIEFENLSKITTVNVFKSVEEGKKSKPLKQHSEEIFVGIVKNIIHDNEKGKVGFLTYQDEDYYFNLPAHHENIENVKVGCDVGFLPQSGTDRKRAKILPHEVKNEI